MVFPKINTQEKSKLGQAAEKRYDHSEIETMSRGHEMPEKPWRMAPRSASPSRDNGPGA
jgi:hypothetical protein